MFGNFDGVLASVRDEVEVPDCWGGRVITAWVLRSDHPDFVAFRKPLQKPSPLANAITRAAAAVSAEHGIRAKGDLDTESQEYKDALVAEVKREIGNLEMTVDSLSDEDLEALKPGIARILIKRWTMLDGKTREPVACTPENVLRALGWEGVHVSFEDEPRRDRWVSKEEFASKHVATKAIAKGEAVAIEYDGHQRNDAGELQGVHSGAYAGQLVGNALAKHWLAAADAHVLAAQLKAEADEKKSEGSRDGELASSVA